MSFFLSLPFCSGITLFWKVPWGRLDGCFELVRFDLCEWFCGIRIFAMRLYLSVTSIYINSKLLSCCPHIYIYMQHVNRTSLFKSCEFLGYYRIIFKSAGSTDRAYTIRAPDFGFEPYLLASPLRDTGKPFIGQVIYWMTERMLAGIEWLWLISVSR